MDTLYLLQFTCFLFMLVNILILGITRLHMKWMNRRYEVSRWLIIGAMVGLAIQFLMQMLLGFRAQDAAVGAVFNILVYPPCFSLISIGIYNTFDVWGQNKKPPELLRFGGCFLFFSFHIAYSIFLYG